MSSSQRRVTEILRRFLASLPAMSAVSPSQQMQAARLQRAVFDGVLFADILLSDRLRLDFSVCPGPPGLN